MESRVMKTEISGQGKPLILVPGGLTGWLSWKPHVDRFSKHYKTIRVQLLNVDMGLRREPIPDDYSVTMEKDALAAVFDKEEIKEADVAAWSFGAAVALSYAISNPGRIRTLTLIEPPAFWVLRTLGPLSDELLSQQKQLQAMWQADITEEQLAWFTHFAGFVPAHINPTTLPAWPSWVTHRQSLAHGAAPYLHDDKIEKVRSFRKPVLLFKSKDSSGFLNKIIDILGEEFPQSIVHDLPGGHALHVINIDHFLEIYMPFLEGSRQAV